MRSIGLLFTPENRNLARIGSKTQTRRGNGLKGFEVAENAEWHESTGLWWFVHPGIRGSRKCPYGNPQAEQVSYYLKEPVRVTALWDSRESNTKYGMALIQYTDDNPEDIIECQQHKVLLGPGDMHKLVSRQDWRKPSSSMFMLRSFARTWLPGVRTWPERLGEMSAEDAIAEGIELDPEMMPFGYRDEFIGNPCWRDYLNGGHDLTPVQSYASLWNSINGPGSWKPEIWTWAIEFQPPATGKPG